MLRNDSTATRHRTAYVDGLKLFYREAGPVGAPAIVLLHGFATSSHMFRDLLPALARDFHVIAPDYPGCGYSECPSPGDYAYRFDDIAASLDKLLASIGLLRFALYMHCHGGPLGLRIAARQPSRITGLVFQNAVAYEDGLSPLFLDIAAPLQRGREARALPSDAAIRRLLAPEGVRFLHQAGARRPDALDLDACAMDQHFLSRPSAVDAQIALLADYMSNVARFTEFHAYFRAHRPPSLVVWGTGDPLYHPAAAVAYERDLDDVRVQLIDSGRFVLEEYAGVIAQHVGRLMTVRN